MAGELLAGGKVTLSCGVCEAVFTRIRSRLTHGRGKHCSPACQYESRRRAPKVAVTFKCIGCANDFDRWPSWSKRKGGGKYCSRECRDKNWIGANTSNFINGDGVYKRGPRWHSIRRKIVERDGYACTSCGATGSLHVHHKTPFRNFTCEAEANHESNLVTLCPPCHRRADADMQRLERRAA